MRVKKLNYDIQKKLLDEFQKQLTNNINIYSECSNVDEYISNLHLFFDAWNTSRIDIKNWGTELNSFRIFQNEIKYEENISIDSPVWFADENGKGIKIEHKNNRLLISLQCIETGNVVIELRGVDFRNLYGERVPIYVNFFNVVINHDIFLDENKCVFHDEPFVISRQSHNLERLNLEIKSETIYDYYPKLRTFFTDIKNKDDLLNEYNNILNYIDLEKKALQKIEHNNDYEESNKLNHPSNQEIFIKKPKLAMFGSCVSIDPFRSCYNNYKKDFEKKYEHQRSTIISLMNPKIDYEDEELTYLLDTHDKFFITNDIKKDFNKAIFQHLDDIDYLIINLVHDIRWGVLEYKDTYITNSEYISQTNFYKNNKEVLRPINVLNNPDEYYELWTKNCDKFFEYLSNNYPNLKVILQKIELVDNYLSFDGTYKLREDFHKQAVTLNPFFKKLENYIENNFEVEVIPFPADTSGDEGNIWGVYSTHYTKTYYQFVYNRIRIISLEDMIKELYLRQNNNNLS